MSSELVPWILAGAAVGWVASCRPKARGVRLVDVWVLGPLMIYAATREERRPGVTLWSLEGPEDQAAHFARMALAAAGAATITYNGRNLLCLS